MAAVLATVALLSAPRPPAVDGSRALSPQAQELVLAAAASSKGGAACATPLANEDPFSICRNPDWACTQ